jgi:hypothetical protein
MDEEKRMIVVAIAIFLGFATLFLLYPFLHPQKSYDLRLENVTYVFPSLNMTLVAYENLPKITLIQAEVEAMKMQGTPSVELMAGDTLHVCFNKWEYTLEGKQCLLRIYFDDGAISSFEFVINSEETIT